MIIYKKGSQSRLAIRVAIAKGRSRVSPDRNFSVYYKETYVCSFMQNTENVWAPRTNCSVFQQFFKLCTFRNLFLFALNVTPDCPKLVP